MPAIARRLPPPVDKPAATRDKLRKSLLSWYDRNGRELPWRLRGQRPDPYRVWLSEVMLQQTTAAAVGPYYARFLMLFPSVQALARAPREDVLNAWAGLGYYSRARNLHAAAQTMAADGIPREEEGWRALPGIGPYTAAAIAAIAHGQAANPVDGNIERVMSRLHAVETPLPAAKAELRAHAAALVTKHRPGDWAQALMDLGATICTPRSPKCDTCPWRPHCAAFAGGAPETYPRKTAKASRPERCGAVFVVYRGGDIWCERRPEKGLLAGMPGLPTTEWRPEAWDEASALAHAPVKAAWIKRAQVRHVFTHFTLTLDVYAAKTKPRGAGFWGDESALPSVFRKAAIAAKR